MYRQRCSTMLLALGLSLGGLMPAASWAQVASTHPLGLSVPGITTGVVPASAPLQAGQLPVPPLSARVMDQTGTLSPQDLARLSEQLAGIEQRHGSQVVVLIIPSLGGEDIATYAYRVADAWKIGRKTVGDGVLVLVAKQDRRLRIEIAKSLEGAIPDLAASQIMERVITPAFKQGDFAGGLSRGIDALGARIAGENLPLPQASDPSRNAGGLENLGILLFMGVPIVGGVLSSILGRKAGSGVSGLLIGGISWYLTASIFMAVAAAFVAVLLIGVMGVGSAGAVGRRSGWGHGGGSGWGGGGGGWGGGSGGGFSSGGGGSFGGGGASGRW